MSIVNSLKKFMGLDDEDDYYDEEDYSYDKEDETVIPLELSKARRTTATTPSAVRNYSTQNNKTIKIVKPKTFVETKMIAEDLRAGIINLVNTTALEKKDAQRMLDFICGAAYALDGLVQEVETGVFVISPREIVVNTHMTEPISKEPESSSFINWKI